MATIHYRPEVDGLRTIAVLAVLIYHASFTVAGRSLLPGGFLGVDVFFVISGYLITSLIRAEYESCGSFSYRNFYERRARRLLPALLIVIVASLPAAWLLLLPSQIIDFSKSVLASVAFGSNVYWHVTMQQYGAESALIKPFLHTWSLAVEEQYYIVFPALLLLCYRLAAGRTPWILGGAFIASLALAVWLTPRSQSMSFYLLPSRFWELLAGAILAHLGTRREIPSAIGRAMPGLGLAMIVIALGTVKYDAGHPGLLTLIPVLGTCLIIHYAHPEEPVTRLLSTTPFVAIGLISYSLYLWHYPVFAFGRIYDPNPSLATKALWIVLSFAGAIAAYKLVEKPCRNRARVGTKRLLITLGTVGSLVMVFCVSVIQLDGLKSRFPTYLEIYGKNEFDNVVLQRRSWGPLNALANEHGFPQVYAIRPTRFDTRIRWFSNDPSSNKVLIVGNSHSKDIFNAFYLNSERYPDHEFARFGMAKDIPERHIELLLDSENFQAADTVVLSVYADRSTLQGLPTLLRALRGKGKAVYLVSNSVGFRELNGLPLFDGLMRQQDPQQALLNQEINATFYRQRIKKIAQVMNQKLNKLASEFEVDYLDKVEVLCDDAARECVGITPDGYKVFYDRTHWTLEGARYFGARMQQLAWLQ